MNRRDHSSRTRLVADLRGLLWVSPFLVGLIVFLLIPAAMSLYYGFTEYSLLDTPVWTGAANYREMMSDRLFWTASLNTAVYAIASVVVSTILAVGLAVLLEQKLRGRELVRAMVFAPTLVPVISAAIAWQHVFNAEHGVINGALRAVGGSGADWLGRPALAMGSLVLMSLWFVGGAVVIYSAALRDVPATLYEAAHLDGMGRWTRFRHVTLPMISPAILFNVVMSLIWSLQVFAVPLVMTNGGPENSTLVYSMYVFKNAFEYGRMGYASALAWVQVVVTLVLAAGAVLLSRRLVHYRES